MDTKELLEKPVRQLFFHYLIPAILGTMVTSVYVLADTIIIGKGIGTIAVAALNIVLPLFNLFFGLGLLFGVGGSVLMSIARGQGKKEEADAYFSVSLLMTIGSLAVCLLICGSFMEEIARMMGGTDETMPYILEYLPWLVYGMGVFFFSSYLQTFIRNDGAPKLAMNAVMTGGILNILLDYLFVYPLRMGIHGAAMATFLGSLITVSILLTHFFSKKNQLRFSLAAFRPALLWEITVNGFASFLIEVASGITIFVFNLQLLKYAGNTGVTVFGVISNTAIVVICLCKGVNQAAQPILSTNFGAGLAERTQKTLSLTLRTSFIICLIPVVIALLVPDLFTYIFLHPDENILALSSQGIRIYFIGFLFMSFTMTYTCYFQAVAKNREALILCLLRGCVLILPLAFVLPLFLKVNGIWLAFPSAEFLAMCVAVRLYNMCLKNPR